MTIDIHNFQPSTYLTIATTTTAVNGTATLTPFSSTNSTPLSDVRLLNFGTSVAYVNWGIGATATATSGIALPPLSQPEKVNAPNHNGIFSAISALGTGSVHITLGNGC